MFIVKTENIFQRLTLLFKVVYKYTPAIPTKEFKR